MSDNLPKISIITVCYNAQEFLERTILSIAAQTYPNIEYIIVDGASKDKTMEIVQQYAQHIDKWISEKDRNLFDAMNKGLKLATGDYILYMNAGDRIKDADSLSAAMQGSNGADLVYANAVYINDAGETRKWHKTPPPPEKLSARSFMDGMVICHHCIIVKRALAAEYNLDWKISSDIDWSIRTLKNVKTKHYFNDVFCLYLEGGISHQNRFKSVRERFRISWSHFGFWATFFRQLVLVWKAIMRGSYS